MEKEILEEQRGRMAINLRSHIKFGYNVIDMSDIKDIKYFNCRQDDHDKKNHLHTYKFISYSANAMDYEFNSHSKEPCESINKRAFECYGAWFEQNNMFFEKKDDHQK